MGLSDGLSGSLRIQQENFLAAKAIGRPMISMCVAIGHQASGSGHASVCRAETD